MEKEKEDNSDHTKVISNDIGLKNRSKMSGTGPENDLETFKNI